MKTNALWLENPPSTQLTSETWYANQIDQIRALKQQLASDKGKFTEFPKLRFSVWIFFRLFANQFCVWEDQTGSWGGYFSGVNIFCLPTNSVCERIRQAARGGSGHCPGFSQAWLSNLDINGRTWNTRGVIFFVWKISWIIPKTCHATALKGLRSQTFKHLFFSFLSQFGF